MNVAGQVETESKSTLQSKGKKLRAVIYLASNRPLHLPDFLAEFRSSWPHHKLEKTGQEPHKAFFRAGHSDFSIELHHTPVPRGITEPVEKSTLHWPAAALSSHTAHIEVAGSAPGHGVLTLACDLTRAIASLLPVTDSLAVCWLSGPALNRAKTFTATAREMFSAGLCPVALWVAAHWDARSHALFTHGMEQFNAPEVLLTRQPDAAPLMVDYLFQFALWLLTSQRVIAEGAMVSGPHGLLRIGKGKPDETGSESLVLEPCS
ncbi:MAG: hypothetical protein ABSG70_00730 [Terriglobales bacterium]|jgi:hypothetical protein